MDFIDEAAEGWDEADREYEESDTWSLEGDAETGDAVCYADHLTHEIYRNAADAMAAYDRRLDEMVEKHS